MKRYLLALIFLTVLHPAIFAAVTQIGNVTNVTLAVDTGNGNTNATFWINNGGVVQVTPFAPDVIRVRYYFTELWSKEEPMIAKASNQWAAVASTFTDQGGTYRIQTPQLDIIVTKSPFKIDFKDKNAGYYLLQDNKTEFNSAFFYNGQSGKNGGGFKLKSTKALPANQAIYGLGEYGGSLNRRGNQLECWSSGTYKWGEFQNPTYMNMPFFYGIQPSVNGSTPYVYGVFFNNPCRPLFSFSAAESGANNMSFQAGDGQMDYFFFGGGASHTMAGVIDRYSELTGRATFLPKWGFGYQQSRFSYGTQNRVQEIADGAGVNDFPLDVVHMDIDYMQYGFLGDGNIRQLSLTGSFYDTAGMLNYCNARGVKLVPLIEPWLEPNDSTLYNDANANFHFIKDNASATVTRSIYVGNVSWFDYTSTAMRQWWSGKIVNWFNSYNSGNPSFAGIWNDLTEPEGGDAIPYNGLLWCDGKYGNNTDSRRQWSNEHNYFGLRASGQSYDTMLAKNPNKRPFILGRSGSSGLQRYAISWSGDTGADWGYQRTMLRFGMGAIIAGAGWYGNDIGGFVGSPTGELMVRSMEWNTLASFCRNHADKNSDNREPWIFGEPYKSMMRDAIKFRYKLMPYLYSLAYNFTKTGEPMNTPTAFKFYPDQNTTSLNDYEFMVGDWLLAAPVINQGATSRSVYLPWENGISWYYWPTRDTYTGLNFNGGQNVTVNAPLGSLPLFVRAGAIIPMGPPLQNMTVSAGDSLDLNCWPSGVSSNTLYEDAGEGWDFTNSTGRVQTTYVSSRNATNWDFTVGARVGGYNPGRTKYYIYCYNPQGSPSVALNGFALTHVADYNALLAASQGWVITTDGKLTIKIPDTGGQQVVHVDWTGAPIIGSGPDVGLPGNWSAWTDTATPWLMGKLNPPGTPAAANWYTNSIAVPADIAAGTYQFKLRANHDWANNWGLNSVGSVNINSTTTLAPSGTTNASITLLSGAVYSFRVLEPTPGNNATIAVMKTAAKPVAVTLAGISPTFPNSNDVVTITINLSATKSAEEHIYVRWTINNWTTSQFTEATVTGNPLVYTATLPAVANGTTVKYYILSSTATTGTGLSHSTADALTLSLDTNAGINYSYTASPIPWPGVGYAYDVINHYKEEAVVGNGYMTAMLDQNGSLYDLYFPSAGVPAGSDTATEGYYSATGPQWPPGCTQHTPQANGQMNLIGAMGGIAVTNGLNNTVYWLKNQNGTDYTDVGQKWVSDDVNVVATSNRLTVAGYNIKVQQFDFVPSTDAIPVDPVTGARSDGVRTNRAVYVKRFLLTNNEATSKTINFYWDANFNVKGDDAYDQMSYEGTVGGTNYNAMIVADIAGRVATGAWCDPNGFGGSANTEYDPSGAPGGWAKSNSVYFATVMKLVTNAVTGAGAPADGSWRDHTGTDNQEGWIGKKVTIPAGQTVEVDVMTVGSWDTFANATGTHNYWGRPMINWFYQNNMANVQAATETYWSNWVSGGVTVNFPDPTYDKLFKRSLLVSKLHCDPVGGAVIAGMHNGAYPFVWPRDGVYAAITFDRTGHSSESTAFYRWLTNAQRPTESWGPGFFYQKYTTDGKPVWRNPQVDETASVPWGMYYHFLATGDGAFLSNNWSLAQTAGIASSTNSAIDFNLNYDTGTHLMWTWNIWEDVANEHLYSNASVVRGLRDAANIADYVGQPGWASTFRARATDIKGDNSKGIIRRINDRVEPSDISHLGLVMPYEVFTPADPLMTNVVEWLQGRQVAGGFTDDIVEHTVDNEGLWRRYNHKIGGEADIYWDGGPWFLASSWFGEYMARWQDYVAGKSLINTNKAIIDKLITKLGPMGLAAEQIAANTAEQKYDNFWLQTAWPNVWESHSTLVDQMMMFLDYKPDTNNTCAFAPKLPSGWTTMKFNNLAYRNQRFDVTISELDSGCSHYARADVNKLTTGTLTADFYLRIPGGLVPVMVVTNGGYYVPAPSDYSTATGRVHIKLPLNNAAGNNVIGVTYDIPGCGACPCSGLSDWDGDGVSDSFELGNATSPINADSDGDTMTDGYEFDNGLNPNVNDAALDKDGDGLNNLAEFLAGTAANDANSLLRITAINKSSNDFIVNFASVLGKLYRVQRNDDLSTTNWVTVADSVPGTGGIIPIPDVGGAAATQRYYRVRLLP